SVTLPLSKSISNRALIMGAMTTGAAPLTRIADCDDTAAVKNALADRSATRIDVGAAGTAMRFLTALSACTPGHTVVIDGSERMRRRPIGALVDALRSLGADISYVGDEGFPPLRITGCELAGGTLSVPASVSSQYISALLMIAPLMRDGLKLTLEGEVTSRPYIDMTLGMMADRGITPEISGDTITVPHGSYAATDTPIEADWSAASYWYEIAAISSGFIDLKGLDPKSRQGDSRVAELFEVFGLQSQFDGDTLELLPTPDTGARLFTDLADVPDLTPALAVTCCLLSIPFNFTGLSTLRIKETDRIAALCDELLKLGYLLHAEGDNGLRWDGVRFPVSDEIPAIATYDDHRMAMAFAPAALFFPGLQINDIEVVSKSYPRFWDDLRSAGFTLEEA
ncbi:MAG: 3-phosphoshikimate 1-carboxyvinyltransferase, partial [Muribaculaceae bacterium]|nr:3-phosphoshikimate 1-carboxyvinyltransferase [Muribaculaceae bacterium]